MVGVGELITLEEEVTASERNHEFAFMRSLPAPVSHLLSVPGTRRYWRSRPKRKEEKRGTARAGGEGHLRTYMHAHRRKRHPHMPAKPIIRKIQPPMEVVGLRLGIGALIRCSLDVVCIDAASPSSAQAPDRSECARPRFEFV